MVEFRELFLKDFRSENEEGRFQVLKNDLSSEMIEHGELEEDRKRQLELRKLIEDLNEKINSL